MRKIVSMLLVIFIVFGSIGFCTDDFKLSGYQWISPEEAYITSNLIVPVSIIIGEEADLRISVYRRTDDYDSSEELLDMTDISNGIRLFEDDETYVIVKDNLFKDTISKKLTDAINIDAIDDEVVDSGIAENNFYDQNYRYYDNNLDKESLSKIVEESKTLTKSMSKTIDDFSNFIKNDKQKITFNIKDNIDKNLKILNASIRTHHITTVLDIKEDIQLNSYPNELTQVFINLINNAKDALKEHDIKNRYIFITTYLEDNKLVLKIKDNALGINKEIIDKIFEPYFTTKHQSQGTGLGLYMSHKIIAESMKGSISAHNIEFDYEGEKYTGSEFVIILPLDVGE